MLRVIGNLAKHNTVLQNVKRFNHPLLSFFDKKENWGQNYIAAGRPWRREELENKSSVDLHKLWYILLKERNMLMTMQEEHERNLENMPNPERFEKIEESMENILLVIEARNSSIELLEKGSVYGPKVVEKADEFGRPVKVLTREHIYPEDEKKNDEFFGIENEKLLRLEREKEILRRRQETREKKFTTRKNHFDNVDKFSDNDL